MADSKPDGRLEAFALRFALLRFALGAGCMYRLYDTNDWDVDVRVCSTRYTITFNLNGISRGGV